MKNVQVNTDGLQFDNANGTHTNVNTSATADTYINLPASSGTLALTSQVGSAPLLARQTGDTTVTNTSTLADTYLTVSAAASTTYAVEINCVWQSSTATADCTQQLFISTPSGATGFVQALEYTSGATQQALGITSIASSLNGSAGLSTTKQTWTVAGYITTTDAGTIKVQIAHATGAELNEDIKLLTGSWMRLTAIA